MNFGRPPGRPSRGDDARLSFQSADTENVRPSDWLWLPGKRGSQVATDHDCLIRSLPLVVGLVCLLAMSSGSEIICRPTKWFVWRALLMLVMFGGFGTYFLYDWKIGYPKKNYIVANYQAFTMAGQTWANDGARREPKAWKKFVSS